jgi:hypothetical protein
LPVADRGTGNIFRSGSPAGEISIDNSHLVQRLLLFIEDNAEADDDQEREQQIPSVGGPIPKKFVVSCFEYGPDSSYHG